MQQQQHVPRQVQPLPYPSLASSLLPQIKETEAVLEKALAELDTIHNWSANDVNHEHLLQTILSLKCSIPLWRQSMFTKLQQLWMNSTTQYGQYRGQIDAMLRKRHVAEILTVFPSLRSVPAEATCEASESALLTADERRVFCHLRSLGVGYDKQLEGPKLRLTALCLGQDREREVFDRMSMAHGDQILAAKQDDVARLNEHLRRSDQLLEALVQAAERKVAAAARHTTANMAASSSSAVGAGGGGVSYKPHHSPRGVRNQGGSEGLGGGRGGPSSARSDRTQVTSLRPMPPAAPLQQ
jgi:hypothetical protein